MELYVWLAVGFFLLSTAVEFYIIFRKRRQIGKKDQAFIISEWRIITKKIESDSRHAVIEADKLLDYCLKKRGYIGSLGEKLKKSPKIFTHIDEVWRAHKLRNRIVHEMGMNLETHEARRALSFFRQALIDLGIKVE